MGELLTKFEPGGRVLKSEALLIPPHHSTETLECGVGENVKPFLWGAILLRRRSRLRPVLSARRAQTPKPLGPIDFQVFSDFGS